MTLASLITSLRLLANDDNTNPKTIWDENLGSDPTTPVDGSNVNFRLKSVPLIDIAQAGVADAVYTWITIVGTGAVYRTRLHTVFKVIDPTNGIIQFITAPNPGSAQGAGVYATYQYYWFSDAKYTEFLNEASSDLQLNAAVDPTTVQVGLVPPMLQYALARFFKARASQYMERYSSSGGEAGQSVESVAKGYLQAASQAEKRGDTLRDSFYKKQGQQLTPAFQTIGTAPRIDPITPIR